MVAYSRPGSPAPPSCRLRVSSPPPGARLPNALVSAGSSHGLRPRWAPLLLPSQVPGSTPPSLVSAVLHAMHVSSSPLSSRHTSPVTCLVALCHLQAVRQHAIPSAYFTPPLAPPLTARSSPLRPSPIAPHPLAKPCASLCLRRDALVDLRALAEHSISTPPARSPYRDGPPPLKCGPAPASCTLRARLPYSAPSFSASA